MHPKGSFHAFGGQRDGGEASGRQRILSAKTSQDVVDIVVELLCKFNQIDSLHIQSGP